MATCGCQLGNQTYCPKNPRIEKPNNQGPTTRATTKGPLTNKISGKSCTDRDGLPINEVAPSIPPPSVPKKKELTSLCSRRRNSSIPVCLSALLPFPVRSGSSSLRYGFPFPSSPNSPGLASFPQLAISFCRFLSFLLCVSCLEPRCLLLLERKGMKVSFRAKTRLRCRLSGRRKGCVALEESSESTIK